MKLKEEGEEKRVAELERKKRATAGSPSVGSDSLLRRFKILMLGDSGVGKSSLILRWTTDTFNPTLVGTVGVDFRPKKVNIEGEFVNIQVWDTAGQEQFHKITTSYYRGANGIMLVYDVADEKSAENVGYWMKNIKRHASENVHLVLVGNKSDLYPTNTVSPGCQAGRNFANKYKVKHFETSAKDSVGVEEAYNSLVRSILGYDNTEQLNIQKDNSVISVNSNINPAAEVSINNNTNTKDSNNSNISANENKLKSNSVGGKLTSIFTMKSAKLSNDNNFESESKDKDKEKCLVS